MIDLKKKATALLFVIFAFVMSMSVVTFATGAKAEESACPDGTFEIVDKVSIKLNENGGMRWIVKADKNVYEYISANDDVELGFIVAPKALMDKADEKYYEMAQKIVVKADKTKIYQVEGDENYYANGCVIKMNEANRKYDYTAAAYIKKGDTIEKYAPVNENSVIDFYDVATKAILYTEEDYSKRMLALSAYDWLGGENFPIEIDTVEKYNSLVGKINDGINFSGRNIEVRTSLDTSSASKLDDGKTFPETMKKVSTVTYCDEDGDIIHSEKVAEGESAAYVYENDEQDITLGNGYTIAYDGYKWVNELNGTTEVSLSEITEDTLVYLKKSYIAYIKAEKYDVTGGYKSVMSFNKYVLADVNGNIEFKVRLNGTSGSSFLLYEKHTWTNSEMSSTWIDGNDWWTVKGEASAKTVTVYKPNGEVAASKVFNEYNAETLSIYLNSNADIAAIDPKLNPILDVTYYDADGTTVLHTEKVEKGDKSAYEVQPKDLGDGYSEIYFNAKWLTAHGGSEIADLTNITENMSVYLSGEKYITKSYEYARQDANGGGLMNYPANVHKYAEIKDGKMEFYVMPHEAYSKFGLMELAKWSAPMQVYFPNADVWYKFVINFGDEMTCSAYNADGTVLDGKENVALAGFTQDNFWMIVYTQITHWGDGSESDPSVFADNGSCEIAFKA